MANTHKPFFPDYKNCAVNIISSVAQNFGVETGHTPNKFVSNALSNNPKNIVIIVLDGLGKSILDANLSENSFLKKHFVSELSSVFPSTTTAATMSFKTGLTPIEHGWLSLFLYFKEVGEAVNLYLNTNAFSRKPVVKEHVAQTVLPYTNILEIIAEKTLGKVRTYAICPPEARDMYNVSQLTYDTFHEMCTLVDGLCSTEEQKVIYAYHNHPDDTMHKFGPYSDEAKSVLLEIDAELEVLAKNCPDTLFIISADHGQHETKELVDLADYPDIMQTLLMPPTGGPRAFNLYIKNGRQNEFKSLIKKHFKDKFILLSKKEVLNMKLFGDGKPHPKIDDLVGDFWLISVDESNLFCSTLYRLSTKQTVGSHGGLTKEEMITPLILCNTKEKWWHLVIIFYYFFK